MGVSVFGRRKKKKREMAEKQAAAEAAQAEQQLQPAESTAAAPSPAPLGPPPFVASTDDTSPGGTPVPAADALTEEETAAEPLFVAEILDESAPEVIDLSDDVIEITDVGEDLPYIDDADAVVIEPQAPSVPVVNGDWPELEPIGSEGEGHGPAAPSPQGEGEIEVLTDDFLPVLDPMSEAETNAFEHIREQVEALEADNARLQIENTELTKIHAALRSALAEQERDRVAVDEQLTQVTEEKAKAKNSKRELTRLHNMLVRDHDDALVARSKLEEELEELRSRLEELQHQTDQTSETLDTERAERDAAQAELKEVKDSLHELDRLKSQLEEADTAIESERTAHEATRAELAEATEAATTVPALNEQLAEAQKALENEQAAHQTTQDALKEATEKASQLEQLTGQLAETNQSLKNERAEHEATRNALRTTTDNVTELTHLKSQLDMVQTELSDTRDSRDVLAIELNSAQKQLEDQLVELRQSVERKDEEIISLENTLRDRDASLEDLRASGEHLRAKLTAARNEADQQRSEVARAEADLKKVTGNFETVQSATEQNAARAEEDANTIARLHREIQSLAGTLAAQERESDQRSERLLQARRELAASNADNDKLATSVNELRAELESVKSGLNQRFKDTDALAERALDAAIRTPRLQPRPDGTGEHEAVSNATEHFSPLSNLDSVVSDEFDAISDGTEPFSPLSHLNGMVSGDQSEVSETADNLIPAADLEPIGDDEDLSEEIPEIELMPLSQTEILVGMQELEPLEITHDLDEIVDPAVSTQQFAGLMDSEDSEISGMFDTIDSDAVEGGVGGAEAEEMGIRPVKTRTDPTDVLFDENAPAGIRLATILNQKPVFIGTATMRNLNLDSRAAYLLSRMDGTVTFGDLLDTSGLAPNDTAEILLDLVMKGVI